jgi:hypothetical protein
LYKIVEPNGRRPLSQLMITASHLSRPDRYQAWESHAENRSRIDVVAKVNTRPEPRFSGFVSHSVEINGVERKQKIAPG